MPSEPAGHHQDVDGLGGAQCQRDALDRRRRVETLVRAFEVGARGRPGDELGFERHHLAGAGGDRDGNVLADTEMATQVDDRHPVSRDEYTLERGRVFLALVSGETRGRQWRQPGTG